MCMSGLPACMFLYRMCAWYPRRAEEAIESPGNEVSEHCESPCRSQILEEQGFLTDEPSHNYHILFKRKYIGKNLLSKSKFALHFVGSFKNTI